MWEHEKNASAQRSPLSRANERMAEVAEQFIASETRVNFNCECGDRDCGEQIPMTAGA